MSANRPGTAVLQSPWAPHPGQQSILESDARFRVVACGRRWGKTEMCANAAAQRLGDPDTLVWWVAPTYDIADIGFEAVEDALPGAVVADGGVKRSKPKAIELVNGSRISFRSADREDSLRGEGLDLLIIDEAAMVPERAWANELRPTLSDTLGDMIAISTPKGRGWFYQWFERGQSDDHPQVASWRSPTYDNPHVSDAEIDSARQEIIERRFRQEYLAEFIDESGGVFENLDATLFTAGYAYRDGVIAHDGEPPYTHGWDFARHQDWTVGIVLDGTGSVVHYDRFKDLSWPQIQQRIERAHQQYEGTVAVDASRDNKLVSDLADTGMRVEAVQFSPKRKRELIEGLAASIENASLTAPEIPQLRHELQIFEYDVTSAGNVRYQAPDGFHDDCVDALALAADAHHAKPAVTTRSARTNLS